MNYLLIQNPGVAPVEGYTLLGMSTTSDCGVDGVIGKFGSGAKQAINVLLRAGLKLYIYCGPTRLEFFTKPDIIDDGLRSKTIQRVMCKMGGTSTKLIDCGWCLDFGRIDWTDTAMALREFVSNAIDRTIRQEGGFVEAKKDGRLSVITATEDQRRAKDGYTRIYVELSPEVQQYYGELPKRFLHFSSDPSQVNKSILPKADRNLKGKTAVIYRCGIFVREITEVEAPSLFDYNFKDYELPIDECRNSSEYATRAACAGLMRKADAKTLAVIFSDLTQSGNTFEAYLDPDYICSSWRTPSEDESGNWKKAWEMVAADAVLGDADMHIINDHVTSKGHKVKTVKSPGWAKAAERMGVASTFKVLGDDDQKGRETLPATQDAQKAVDTVWGWLESLEMTQGKDKPQVACYRDIMNAECEVHGYQKGDHVYLREDIADGLNKYLLKVAYEEVVHYVTGATDNSRDFQNFLIDCFIAVAA